MLPSIGSDSRQIHDLLKVSAFIYHEKPLRIFTSFLVHFIKQSIHSVSHHHKHQTSM